MTHGWRSHRPVNTSEGALDEEVWAEFKEFMNRGDFVTIAVGLIIALQTVAVVNAIIEGIINPIIAAILGKNNLSDFGFDIGDARISIGLVISALITFLVVLAILFVALKAWNAPAPVARGRHRDRAERPQADPGRPQPPQLRAGIRAGRRRASPTGRPPPSTRRAQHLSARGVGAQRSSAASTTAAKPSPRHRTA